MSRQMAFQITEFEFQETLKRLADTYDQRDPNLSIGEWIDSFEPDPKKRQRIRAVLLVSTELQKKGVDFMRVKKVVCWRNEKGEPGEIHMDLHAA